VVICLERGADLHMAQLMPLPLTVSCFSKIQLGFTFLVRLTSIVPDKGPLNVCVFVRYRIILLIDERMSNLPTVIMHPLHDQRSEF